MNEWAHSFSFSVSLKQYTAERSVDSFGDEWNIASERGSIQPRVPFQALGGLEQNRANNSSGIGLFYFDWGKPINEV
jgi:hypothetical protein